MSRGRASLAGVCVRVLSLLLTRCSTAETNDGGACTQVESCGGEVSGSWSLADACYLSVQQPMVEGCEAASASAEVRDPRGEVSFDGSGTYRFNFSVTMGLTVHVPEACLHQQAMSIACAELGGPLARGEELVCAAADGGCDCDAELAIIGDDTGSYTLRDERLSLRSEPFDYCVQGDQLLLNHRVEMEVAGKDMITLLQLSLRRR